MLDGRGRFLMNEIVRHFGNNLITGTSKQRRGIYLTHEGILGFKLNFFLEKNNVDINHLKEWYENFGKAISKKFDLDIRSYNTIVI